MAGLPRSPVKGCSCPIPVVEHFKVVCSSTLEREVILTTVTQEWEKSKCSLSEEAKTGLSILISVSDKWKIKIFSITSSRFESVTRLGCNGYLNTSQRAHISQYTVYL